MKNMKKMMTVLALVACMALCAITCAGCGNSEKKADAEIAPVHAVFVLGAHANSPVIRFDAVSDLLDRCVREDSTLTIICADGSPYVSAKASVPPMEEGLSPEKQKTIREENAAAVTAALEGTKAKSDHADYLRALSMASDDLASYNDGTEKVLVVMGSMLSDVKPLDFSSMVLNKVDSGAAVDGLSSAGAVPNFKDVTVHTYFMGSTVAPQKSLTDAEKDNLAGLYTGLFKAGGAKDVNVHPDLASESAYEGLPKVNVVPVMATDSVLSEKEVPDAVTLADSTLGFEPDSTAFTDTDKARSGVETLCAYMRQNPDCKALLVGTTAKWGDDSASIKLSYERGLAVKRLFTDAGISADRISVVGTGWHSCFYKNDGGPDALNEEIAPENRSTVWVRADSALAKQVMESTESKHYIRE